MSINPPPPTRSELQELSRVRLKEAKVLFENQLFDGSVYLAGYALELALKARICRLLDSDYPQRDEFKSFLTHRYSPLIRLGGLDKTLDQAKINPDFATNWSLLNGSGTTNVGWSETWRYRRVGSVSDVEAQELLNALEEPLNGILPWLHKLW